MAKQDSLIKAAFLLLVVIATPGSAQIVETPVPFDSGGKVQALTPALVSRLALRAPAWPAAGQFVEARLYSVSSGGTVLSVARSNGQIERYALSNDQVAALRSAVDGAMTRSGTIVTESRTDLISQPARGAFVRNQMLLTWGLYGPLLSSLTNDAKTGTVVFLAATGASYFVTTAIGKRMTVTRAQNHLSTDGAMRGAATAAGLLYLAQDTQPNNDVYAGVALAGALTGTVAGFNWGRGRTDSEAEATTTLSNLFGLTALGVSGAFGGFEDSGTARGVVGGVLAAGLTGYAIGPNYPRKARYAVTRGDVQMLQPVALLGAAAAVAPFLDDSVSAEMASTAATAGLLAGAWFADRMIVRRYDYSTADATQALLGLVAGGLLGAAAVVLTEPSEVSVGFGMVTAGAILGTYAGHRLANPARRGEPRVGARPVRDTPSRSAGLQFRPASLLFAASRVPGRHALLELTF